MWALEYNQEASNYALDSYPYNEEVLMAIESLAMTTEGLPTEAYIQLEPEYYLWEIAQHTVIFRRIMDETLRLRILVIKPSND